MTVYNVCLTFDINYSGYAKVLIESISRNLTSGHEVDILVLTGCEVLLELNGSDFNAYPNISLSFIDVSSELGCFRQAGRFPPQVYARLLMHKYINTNVLYLDVDIIVNCCLSEIFLYHHSLLGLSACLEEGVYLRNIIRCNFKTHPPYFNAGVLLCDFSNNIAKEKFDLAITLAQKNDYLLADQDALNFAFDGNFDVLPQTFNDTTILFSKNSAIIHFAHIKPTRQLVWLDSFNRYSNYLDDLNLSFSLRKYSILEISKKICFVILSKTMVKWYRFLASYRSY